MPSYSRRSHTKSRNGCSQCKSRKRKCDERLPRCGDCSKRHITCDYEVLGCPPTIILGRTQLQNASHAIHARQIARPIASLPMHVETGRKVSQLELLHHFVTATSSTLADTPVGKDLWRNNIPHEALSQQYVMHSILAVSALHIASLHGLNVSSPYLRCAQAHHDKALTVFSSQQTEINPSNCLAFVSFSCLFLIFSCDITGRASLITDHGPVDSMINLMNTFRKFWKLLSSIWPQMKDDDPSGQFLTSLPTFDSPVTPAHATEAMRILSLANELSQDSEARKTTYHKTIVQMQQCLRDGYLIRRFQWPIMYSDDYMLLVQEKHPMALAILCYGCVLLKNMPDRWYFHDLLNDVVRSIAVSIDPIWAPLLQWPLATLNSGGEVSPNSS